MQKFAQSQVISQSSRTYRSAFRVRHLDFMLLFPILLFGTIFLIIELDNGVVRTILLFHFVVVAGLYFTRTTAKQVGDQKLGILGVFWLLKIFLTLFLLHFGWMPMLDPSSAYWGYDPQRFYLYAQEVIENDWETSAIGLNYFGIVYYYAAIFIAFGINPVAPALVNSFVTLAGTLLLIRAAYSFTPYHNEKSYHIAWLLLVPEVLWFDVMTARETIMAILLAVLILKIGEAFAFINKLNMVGIIIIVLAIFGILAIRTTMILPILATIGVMAFTIRKRKFGGAFAKWVAIVLVLAAIGGGPVLQTFIGGYGVEYAQIVSSIQNFENNVASQSQGWSENSIGLLLAPKSAFQALVFLPFRMVLYLAAPLPSIGVSLQELVMGNWMAWQWLMTALTSAVMLIGFPYVLAGSIHAWRNRFLFPSMLVIPIGFWVTFIAVAGGNIIIHERYRLMCTLLLFACMWLGYTQSRLSSVQRYVFLWYSFLGGAALFYVLYKIL